MSKRNFKNNYDTACMINLYTWLDNYPDNKKISKEELNK